MITCEEMLKVFYEYRVLVEKLAFGGTDDRIGVIGMAACHVAQVALYDENLLYDSVTALALYFIKMPG